MSLQGIKFYEPEVVGATPEAVEFRGMQNLLGAVKEHVGYRHGKLIFSADGQVGFSLVSGCADRLRSVLLGLSGGRGDWTSMHLNGVWGGGGGPDTNVRGGFKGCCGPLQLH